ncbi:MAG TPA: cell division protein FtsW [Persephonella sp.]|uniref:Probable peptidoglycan glycosyltransferase FtsW n=1 Tax=Persephonella marina (strain DSM 14350 / EX-H1) TaxID=123214 RepID=C0QUP7_PERMH|nr:MULTISPECIES: putative peptidoglycan glycosyltransferase FtsW [Persephonella]ACO03633.1 cell cycle protein [Persephonella marina EX-H1]HCB69972.1 cell division protein FtsW [Persephonella sp.]
MVRDFYFDRILLLCFIILFIYGIVFVFSATSVPSLINNKDPYLYLKKEILWVFIGFSVMVASYLTPVNFWKKISYPAVIISIVLLVMVLIFPAEIKGTSVKRWLDLGFFKFQPSELAKISTVLFLANFIHRKEKYLKSWEAIISAITVPALISALILVEPHKGAAFFILILTFLIMFSANFDWKKLVIFPVVAVPVFLYIFFSSEYAYKRILALIDPMGYKEQFSYQVFQSILAFSKGGLTGEGIGAGTQKLRYLPEIHTDYIYALIGEETGFLGASFLVIIFLVILLKGINISIKLEDRFSQVLGVGLTFLIVIQAFFHFAVNTSLLPPTGFTLPFVSYGGTSLFVMSLSAGILLRLSKEPVKTAFHRRLH